jgi:hypothetical protein
MKKIWDRFHYYAFVRKSKWNYIILIPVAIFFVYIFWKASFIKEGNYTVGYVYRIYWPIVNAKTIMYSYTVKDVKYTSTTDYNDNLKPEVGKYYLVRVSLEDSQFSEIFQDIPVPDSIKEVPSNGWKEPPEWADKNKLKEKSQWPIYVFLVFLVLLIIFSKRKIQNNIRQ